MTAPTERAPGGGGGPGTGAVRRSPVTRPVIGVATYRRPELLAELLRSIGRSVGPARPRIVVVDNDPAGSAAGVAPAAGYPHEYHHESTPGIAAARNRVLSLLQDGEDAVIFVDDDEVVDTRWYATLVDASRDADVVSGPVVARYGHGLPRWVVRGRFFDRDRQASGDPTRHPATNNVLVRVDALRRLQGRWFREDFSSTGGSDTELFDRMRRHGARLVWCDDALVHEDVPRSRATARWLWRRNVRLGNVTSRVRFAGTPRALQVLLGTGRMGAGAALSVLDLVRCGHLTREHATHVPKGWGMLTAALGLHVEEYRR